MWIEEHLTPVRLLGDGQHITCAAPHAFEWPPQKCNSVDAADKRNHDEWNQQRTNQKKKHSQLQLFASPKIKRIAKLCEFNYSCCCRRCCCCNCSLPLPRHGRDCGHPNWMSAIYQVPKPECGNTTMRSTAKLQRQKNRRSVCMRHATVHAGGHSRWHNESSFARWQTWSTLLLLALHKLKSSEKWNNFSPFRPATVCLTHPTAFLCRIFVRFCSMCSATARCTGSGGFTHTLFRFLRINCLAYGWNEPRNGWSDVWSCGGFCPSDFLEFFLSDGFKVFVL